jgi:hypothetical protein
LIWLLVIRAINFFCLLERKFIRVLELIALYAVALFLTGWLLLDMESMLASQITSDKELDIPGNDEFIDFELQEYSLFYKATLAVLQPKTNPSWQD